MKNFSLPTPEEAGYNPNPGLDLALSRIKNCINSGVFRLKPESNWGIFVLSDVNEIIKDFGWKIKATWSGYQDDSCSMWEIRPLK